MISALFCRSLSRAALATLALGAATAAATAGGPTPYVIELFTSQGCSSCPPADRLLSQMAKTPDVLALSLPVDYWDYMGWKDTLARPEFATLQKRYAAARGDNHVYTPQAVIDGLVHVVGSNEKGIVSAARASYGASGALSIPLALEQRDGAVVANVGPGNPAAKSGLFWLVRVAKQRTVTISDGENKGRTLTYTNVVRSLRQFGQWSGAAKSIVVPPPQLDADADSYVVLLQAGTQMRPGAILAAVKGESH
jgi:hypothetical protein